MHVDVYLHFEVVCSFKLWKIALGVSSVFGIIIRPSFKITCNCFQVFALRNAISVKYHQTEFTPNYKHKIFIFRFFYLKIFSISDLQIQK